MRRLLVLILVIGSISSGCSNDEVSFSEVSIDKVKKDVKDFILHIETSESNKGNGIYMFNDSEKNHYLYLNQDFLESKNGFGSLDIKVDDNSWNLYLSEGSEVTELVDEYKLYKIKLNEEYEYMKVFKNGEETYFQTIGA
ncbi:hypothetical protein H7992_03830 [Sporosarcina sp. resist]|uniref:hypothetical protein n=1 Tax=Sporosarcina sp. resist TaxID=2762563 RepID=UPI00164D4155|nr:hypothetical protein [Sporosarcina sp. resist]QNK88874.1 hypothetical protein H7992_03830 [Sporosarcina sp. resist]